MTQYIGLDAHSKTCTAVVMDSKGKILKKEVFPTSERELFEVCRLCQTASGFDL